MKKTKEKLQTLMQDLDEIQKKIFEIKEITPIEKIKDYNILIGGYLSLEKKIKNIIKDLEKQIKRSKK